MSSALSSSIETDFVSNPLTAPTILDNGPGRYRIGLIALATDYVVERDFMNMRPSDDVAIYVLSLIHI